MAIYWYIHFFFYSNQDKMYFYIYFICNIGILYRYFFIINKRKTNR